MSNAEPLPNRPPSVMEEPSVKAVARVYADAFLKVAAASGIEGALEELGSFLHDVLDRNPAFRDVLLSPVMTRDDKVRLIDRTIARFGTPLFVNFLRVLAQHDRLELLPVILAEAQLQWELSTGRRRVQITAARPLSDAARERIAQQLRETQHFEPIIATQVDPALLGGMILRVGDTIYDTSLRTRLRQLGHRLHQRSRHEIQSGRDRFRIS